jgi:hypothetical protein
MIRAVKYSIRKRAMAAPYRRDFVGCAAAHEGTRVPELIAEVGRREKEGVVL